MYINGYRKFVFIYYIERYNFSDLPDHVCSAVGLSENLYVIY